MLLISDQYEPEFSIYFSSLVLLEFVFVFVQNIATFFLSLFFFFFFWPHPRHAEVLGPGMEPEPQQWQHQIFNHLCHQGTPKYSYFYNWNFSTCFHVSVLGLLLPKRFFFFNFPFYYKHPLMIYLQLCNVSLPLWWYIYFCVEYIFWF